MLKAVLFDMDGVIFDSEPVHFEVDKRLLKALNVEITDQELSKFVGTASKKMWSDIKEKYQLSQTVEELIEGKNTSYLEYLLNQFEWKPIPGVIELIKDLNINHIKLAVASSSRTDEIQTVIRELKIQKYFDVIAAGDEVNNGKPDPDIFLLAAKRLGIKRHECIVIEDSKNGIAAAKAAGMKCIGFYNPNSGDQDLSSADMIIKSFFELNYQRIIDFSENI